MATFTYRGRDLTGKEVSGILDAATRSLAAENLQNRKIIPLDITEKKASGFRMFESTAESSVKRITHTDILLFTRQMYSLNKAGIPMMRALAGMQESVSSEGMRYVIEDLRESLDSGRDFSSSIARHPKVFKPFYVSMTRVGELTGQLDEIFMRLYEHLEFERFMRDQIKAATRYPMFVIIAITAAIVIVNIFVIPQFAQVFKKMGAELPVITRGLIAFSNFTVTWWPAMVIGLVLAVLGFKTWVNTDAGRHIWDRTILRLPLAGKIISKSTMARFARSFAIASKSGVPLTQALSQVARTVDNQYYGQKIEGMRESMERGESMLRSAIHANIFSPILLQMIAVGEESGALDDMMEEIAGMYQRDVEYDLKALSSQIEPILIIFLGAMVLLLALGIFVPMWDMGNIQLGKS